MKILALLSIPLGIALIFPTSSEAGCRWEWLCDASGDCIQAPVCDSTVEVPPVRPPEVAPVVPPDITPITPPTIPPIGTTDCHQVRRCDDDGTCVWDTVCR